MSYLFGLVLIFVCAAVHGASPAAVTELPRWGHNLLLDAEISGNLESFGKGLRGRPDDVVYDVDKRCFVHGSAWHEYGVGFAADLGVVPEDHAAYWMAEWNASVEANCIVFSGAYPNQPQPKTAWKIELRRNGVWTTHARGVGGWYNHGCYEWGGVGKAPLRFDALRVSLFSSDTHTPLKSIHFRGAPGRSWLVMMRPPIDAMLLVDSAVRRTGQPISFRGRTLLGAIAAWRWQFGDGASATGPEVAHEYAKPGRYVVKLTFSDGTHVGAVKRPIVVAPPVEARIKPLLAPVLQNQPVTFQDGGSYGAIKQYQWNFGDGVRAEGKKVLHRFDRPGVYKVVLTVTDGTYHDSCFALVRAHTPATVNVPQVVLDTDQKNEQDDQHYLGYAVFSELDVLGVDSIHHGGGQEPENYAEILHVLKLARASGAAASRIPMAFRGANQRLDVPSTGRWFDTEPIVTSASQAILAAARGAAPDNPVWVVPVGPGTNVASAILMARRRGLDLKKRLRVMWLGGSDTRIGDEFNANNDPWSMYVVTQSGVPTWIMPAPVGARVRIDKRIEATLYPDNPLGHYLREIVPARDKALYDPACLAAIISLRLHLDWIRRTEPVVVGGIEQHFRWHKTDRSTSVRVIRDIDQAAMKKDIFDTLNGKPQRIRTQ